jgi:hypothetical protein
VVVPGSVCAHHRVGVRLDRGLCPRVRWPEARAVGGELHQRGAVGAQEFDEIPERPSDLGIDTIARKTGEPRRDLREERLELGHCPWGLTRVAGGQPGLASQAGFERETGARPSGGCSRPRAYAQGPQTKRQEPGAIRTGPWETNAGLHGVVPPHGATWFGDWPAAQRRRGVQALAQGPCNSAPTSFTAAIGSGCSGRRGLGSQVGALTYSSRDMPRAGRGMSSLRLLATAALRRNAPPFQSRPSTGLVAPCLLRPLA